MEIWKLIMTSTKEKIKDVFRTGKWETLQSTDLAFKTWQYRAKFTDFKGLLMTLILPTWSVVSSSELPWLRKRCLKPFDSSLKDFSSAVLSSPRTCLASWEQHWGRQCWQTLRQALAVLTALPLTAQDRLKKITILNTPSAIEILSP